MKEAEEKLTRFLKKSTGHSNFGRKTDLVAKGIVSSFNMLELIDFIEKEFEAKIDVDSLNPKTFNTVERIARKIRIWLSK